tara:strand:+ start:175 stop:375 length:201 start_codon:yes stop_codon:yes gene_type:complete
MVVLLLPVPVRGGAVLVLLLMLLYLFLLGGYVRVCPFVVLLVVLLVLVVRRLVPLHGRTTGEMLPC